MAWCDLGIIFKVDKLSSWAYSHFYAPSAILLKDRIRIFGGFWDENMHSRLGFVDVDIDDPSKVINYATEPLLSDGKPGTFDMNGTTPLTAMVVDNKLRIYYAGWQKFDFSHKRYTIFTGLAVGEPEDVLLTRFSEDSIIGPRFEDELVRTGCLIMKDKGVYRNWFASFSKVIDINGKITPAYNLSTMTSEDGFSWNNKEDIIFPIRENAIMGYGRSAVWKEGDNYQGLFAVREWSGRYCNVLYYSTSKDGIHWEELSKKHVAFQASYTCDAQKEVCSPSIIIQKNRMLMFYNGDDFGKYGLRLAIWQ